MELFPKYLVFQSSFLRRFLGTASLLGFGAGSSGRWGARSGVPCGAGGAVRCAPGPEGGTGPPRTARPRRRASCPLPASALGHVFVKILAPVLQVAPEWFRCDRHSAVCPGVSKQTPACPLRFPYLEMGWRDPAARGCEPADF